MPINADKMTLGPLDQCGVWRIEEDRPTISDSRSAKGIGSQTAPLLEIACNLANASESDIRPSEELIAEKISPSPVLAGLGSRPIWFWLLLMGLGLTSIEWCLYQRRVIT